MDKKGQNFTVDSGQTVKEGTQCISYAPADKNIRFQERDTEFSVFATILSQPAAPRYGNKLSGRA